MTKLEGLLSRCKELIKTQKEQLAEKETQIGEQTEKLAAASKWQAERDSLAAQLAESARDKLDAEQRIVVLNEQVDILKANVEKAQKRCADLNSELDEKSNLFQKQFQLFIKRTRRSRTRCTLKSPRCNMTSNKSSSSSQNRRPKRTMLYSRAHANNSSKASSGAHSSVLNSTSRVAK